MSKNIISNNGNKCVFSEVGNLGSPGAQDQVLPAEITEDIGNSLCCPEIQEHKPLAIGILWDVVSMHRKWLTIGFVL